MNTASVINVSGLPKDHLARLAPSFVYVGRGVPRRGFKASPWGNPFKAGMSWLEARRMTGEEVYADGPIQRLTAAEAVRFFLLCLKNDHPPEALAELRGKALGCWCCDWEQGEPIVTPCHAIVLALYADGVLKPEDSGFHWRRQLMDMGMQGV